VLFDDGLDEQPAIISVRGEVDHAKKLPCHTRRPATAGRAQTLKELRGQRRNAGAACVRVSLGALHGFGIDQQGQLHFGHTYNEHFIRTPVKVEDFHGGIQGSLDREASTGSGFTPGLTLPQSVLGEATLNAVSFLRRGAVAGTLAGAWGGLVRSPFWH